MKRLIFISLFFVLGSNSFSQAKCNSDLDNSPRLINLKLGMSVPEVNRVFGRDLKVKAKAKAEGQRTFFKNYIKKKAKGNLKGIRALFIRFYKGKIYQIEIFYETDQPWQNLSNFINEYSTENNFPKEFWQMKYGYSNANCQGFSLDADYILNPHIQLTNDSIAKIVEIERTKKEEKTKD